MARRRIKIIRSKTPEVIRMPATKFLHASYGAGAEKATVYLCMWCFTGKKKVTDKCTSCKRFGTTTRQQKEISQVYLEDNPVFSDARTR